MASPRRKLAGQVEWEMRSKQSSTIACWLKSLLLWQLSILIISKIIRPPPLPPPLLPPPLPPPLLRYDVLGGYMASDEEGWLSTNSIGVYIKRIDRRGFVWLVLRSILSIAAYFAAFFVKMPLSSFFFFVFPSSMLLSFSSEKRSKMSRTTRSAPPRLLLS